MEVYLRHLASDDFHLIPLFHTVRGQERGLKALLPVRLAIEFLRIVRALVRYRPDVVHCLGRYREAIPREVLLAGLCRIFRIPLVYDVKAGLFIDAYRTRGRSYRFFVELIIASSAAVLAEGAIYLPFLKNQFDRDGIFFPNFVPDAEVPQRITPRLRSSPLRVLFVGFCHPSKGVIELFDGCRQFAIKGGTIELTIIGAATPEVASHIDSSQPVEGFVCNSMGRRSHEEVRSALETHDVFCLPSRWEGHSNAITEAMMSGMVVACSRVGFLEAVVEERGGYLFDNLDAEAVAATLIEIQNDPAEARKRAAFAHRKVRDQFVASIARRQITGVYRAVTNHNRGNTPG